MTIMEQVHKVVVHVATPYSHQSRHGRCGSVSHCLKFAALRGTLASTFNPMVLLLHHHCQREDVVKDSGCGDLDNQVVGHRAQKPWRLDADRDGEQERTVKDRRESTDRRPRNACDLAQCLS
jgi:hypothetical protein